MYYIIYCCVLMYNYNDLYSGVQYIKYTVPLPEAACPPFEGVWWTCDVVSWWTCDVVSWWTCDVVSWWTCDLVSWWTCDVVSRCVQTLVEACQLRRSRIIACRVVVFQLYYYIYRADCCTIDRASVLYTVLEN